MQRFKDFTKKSGKVASAILSAAMVTSMVAGTNVVYAATEATEATTDVTAETTQEKEKEAAIAAANEYAAAVKNLPVTSKTVVTGASIEDGFKNPKNKSSRPMDFFCCIKIRH